MCIRDRFGINALNVYSWPIWSCEVSEFQCSETCLILEGRVIVTTDYEDVTIKAGDFVVFPKGLSCHWNVIQPIRKHYSFG